MAILLNTQISGKLTISGSRDDTVTLPNYTTTERDALSAAAGDIVFNETTSKTQFYTGNAWSDAVGRQGAQGAQGFQGLHGTPGGQGNDGSAGAQGATGGKGSAGPQGYHGLQGSDGAGGDTGTAGPGGPAGDTGYQGLQGTVNNSGGATGNRGPKGPQGPAGYTGNIGPPGGAGNTGTRGSRSGPGGGPGPTGYQGLQGGVNNQGGAQGPRGPKGPQGTSGYTGYHGNAGGGGPTGPPGWPYQSMDSNSSPQFNTAAVAHNVQSNSYRLWASSHYAVNHSELYNTNNYGMNHRGNASAMNLINKNNATAAVFYSNGNIFMDGSRWSDERSKTQIEAYSGSGTEPSASIVERLSAIKPKKFRFRNTPSDSKYPITIGLIAQDVKTKFPELVNAKNDGTGSADTPEMMGINFTGLRAVLYEAVKEIKTELSGITNRVTTLENA